MLFAPKPRDYSKKMNKKERAIAIKSALTSRVDENKFIVIDQWNFDEIKTKKMKEVLNNFDLDRALLVLDKKDENIFLSARNIPKVRTILSNSFNVYDILMYDNLILTKEAVAQLEEVYA